MDGKAGAKAVDDAGAKAVDSAVGSAMSVDARLTTCALCFRIGGRAGRIGLGRNQGENCVEESGENKIEN